MRNHEKANQHTYSTDGTRIAFSQIGSGPALLLIHGSGSDQNSLVGLAALPDTLFHAILHGQARAWRKRRSKTLQYSA